MLSRIARVGGESKLLQVPTVCKGFLHMRLVDGNDIRVRFEGARGRIRVRLRVGGLAWRVEGSRRPIRFQPGHP